MPNRYIRETITTSETLAQVSADAERLFWRLVVLADDYGLYDGRLTTLLGKALTAFLGRISAEDVSRWLDELSSVGLISLYETDGKPFLRLRTFAVHQGQPRAKKPKYPRPLASDCNCNQLPADDGIVFKVVTPPDSNPDTNTNTNTDKERGVGGTIPAPDSVREVFEYYRAKIQPGARLIPAAREKIKNRLEEYSPAQLRQAVDKFAADPWRMENNSHEGAAWFFHSQERIEQFLALAPRARPSPSGRPDPPRPELPNYTGKPMPWEVSDAGGR